LTTIFSLTKHHKIGRYPENILHQNKWSFNLLRIFASHARFKGLGSVWVFDFKKCDFKIMILKCAILKNDF